MSAMKKGLGRGFESLLPANLIDETFDPTAEQDHRLSVLQELPLNQITPDPDQPRRQFDEDALAELTASVKAYGVIQPIIVIEQDGDYQIVAGERRYRAAAAAGLKTIPAIIRSMTDQHKLEVALIENIQRRDLNVIETATAYAKLRDQFQLSHEAIGQRVHKSASSVNNTIRLLKLPKEVLLKVADGTLSEGQVRPLISLDRDAVMAVLDTIIKEGWSARQAEQYAATAKSGTVTASQPNRTVDTSAYEARLQQLQQRLNTRIALKMNAQGAGKLEIAFKNADELQRIQEMLAND